MINLMKWMCLASIVLISGCMSSQHVLDKSPNMSEADYQKASANGRYSILQDQAPTGDIKVDHLPNLIPKWEPKSKGGNKPVYEVWGKSYRVMDSAEGYSATGTASWYGKKFHGHKTSNGEVYDMYRFSAAHKSLPLPTYLKVTNLDNNRSVIVRVNDRGPFHGDRLIDLSYAAAARLDYHKKGLARVKIEAITPSAYGANESVENNPPVVASVSATAPDEAFTHLQLGAFSTEKSADSLKAKLFQQFDTQIKVIVNKQDDNLYKVLVGPYKDPQELAAWSEKLEKTGFTKPVRVAFLP